MQAAANPENESVAGLQPINALLFGDSVDYRVARHLCNISKHQEALEPFGSDPIGQEHNMTGFTRFSAHCCILHSHGTPVLSGHTCTSGPCLVPCQ